MAHPRARSCYTVTTSASVGWGAFWLGEPRNRWPLLLRGERILRQDARVIEEFEGAPVVVHEEPAGAWRAWLAEHHETATSVWLAIPRDRGRGYVEAVCEALCFGWVDSVTKPRDPSTLYQRFSPRRPGSTWVKSNRERVAMLIEQGRMTEAGLRVVEAAKASGAWDLFAEVEEGIVPDDVQAALDAVPEAAARFAAFPPSARLQILIWIVRAKRPETRAQRIAVTVEKAARGERSQ